MRYGLRRDAEPFWTLAILCLLVALGAPQARGQDRISAASIDVPQATQARLQIETVPLTTEQRKTQIAAFAKVLDPGPLAQLCSDLFAAEAAAAASGAEARRARALHAADATMSAKDLETAVAQAKSDASKLLLLRQRLGLEWGPGIARLPDQKLRTLVHGISAGAVALVHVDTPSNEGQKDARVVDIDIGTDSVRGLVLGPARVAEPRLSSSGLLVEVTGPSSVLLSVGLTQSAHIDTGTPVQGTVLPRAALLRYRGSTWAYVRQGAERFQRRLVQGGIPEDAGLFVPSGFAVNEQVVRRGVAMLFAVEQSQTAPQSSQQQYGR